MSVRPGRVFLVGCPRSGTTLLQSFLAAHPRVLSLPETHFFPDAAGSRLRRRLGIRGPKAKERLRRILLDAGRPELLSLVPRRSIRLRPYVRAFAAALDRLATEKRKSVWLEKTPRHLHYLPEIRKHLPDALVLHVVRSGKDVVASLSDVTRKFPEHWGGERSIEKCVDRWNEDVVRSLRHLDEPGHLVIRYEDLVGAPERTLRRICGFLGLPWSDKMIEGRARSARRIATNAEEWKEGVSGELSLANDTKFQRIFTEEQQALIRRRLLSVVLPIGPAPRRGRRIRVLHMPDAGGGNPYQALLAAALARRGCAVTLARATKALPVLGELRGRGRTDVFHLHWAHWFVVADGLALSIVRSARFLAELLVLRARRVTVVWTIHNLLDHEGRHPRWELFMNRLLARLVNGMIAHGESARRRAIDAYRLPRRIARIVHVVPHGHYVDRYPEGGGSDEARRRLGLGTEETAYLHFGQIRRYKGVEALLGAFGRLARPELRLLVAGRIDDPRTERALRRAAESDDRVVLHSGFVPDEEVWVWFRAADVVVLPYERVLTSGSAVLAMSFGKAVVAPRRGGCAELLSGQGELLYDPSDEAGLVAALERARSLDLAAIGRANLARAKELDWDRIAGMTTKVYGLAGGR